MITVDKCQVMSAPNSGDELTLLSRDELAERVRQRTAALENVMDTMADVLVTCGPDGRIRLANAAVADRLGYQPDALTGKPIDVLFADEAANQELTAMVSAGEFVERLLRERQVTDLECTLETAAGQPVPVILSASVMTDDEGTIDGIVCVATDITRRVAAEDRAAFLHSLLRHDLGNKLSVMDGYLELLEETALDDQQETYLSYARCGVDDAIELVENVRLLRQLEDGEEVHPVDLSAVIDSVVSQHAALAARQDMTVETDVQPVSVMGGRLLSELFSNLLENALVHSGGSTVALTVRDTGSDHVCIDVEDDGTGLPDEPILERGVSIGEHGGSGLGTHLANRIAERYGGSLSPGASELGGARFRVELPHAD